VRKMLEEHLSLLALNYLWELLLLKEEQMAKKTKDYKSMKPEDLKKELIANRKVLFENNFKHKMGQLKESHMLKETKKEIARIKTELSKENGS
jgi:large subunit ribosomal protein L29